MNSLLLAALDQNSELRMARYREAVEQADTLEDLLDVAMPRPRSSSGLPASWPPS